MTYIICHKLTNDCVSHQFETKEEAKNWMGETDGFEVREYKEPLDDTSKEAQTANKKLAREVQDEMTQKEPWYEHESPEEDHSDNGNLPPGYSDRDL
jgi:hypothetical protein